MTGNRLGPSGSGVVLLTEDGVLPKETKDYLAGIDPAVSKVYAVGGHCVAAVATGEPGWKGKVTNLAGADRYATAAAVAGSAMFPPVNGGPLVPGIATGRNWPDALTRCTARVSTTSSTTGIWRRSSDPSDPFRTTAERGLSRWGKAPHFVTYRARGPAASPLGVSETRASDHARENH